MNPDTLKEQWDTIKADYAAHIDEVSEGAQIKDEVMTAWRSGTTASAVLIDHSKNIGCVANVGDSKIILGRQGHAVPLTVDHHPSEPEEVARIEKAGYEVVPCMGVDRITK